MSTASQHDINIQQAARAGTAATAQATQRLQADAQRPFAVLDSRYTRGLPIVVSRNSVDAILRDHLSVSVVVRGSKTIRVTALGHNKATEAYEAFKAAIFDGPRLDRGLKIEGLTEQFVNPDAITQIEYVADRILIYIPGQSPVGVRAPTAEKFKELLTVVYGTEAAEAATPVAKPMTSVSVTKVEPALPPKLKRPTNPHDAWEFDERQRSLKSPKPLISDAFARPATVGAYIDNLMCETPQALMLRIGGDEDEVDSARKLVALIVKATARLQSLVYPFLNSENTNYPIDEARSYAEQICALLAKIPANMIFDREYLLASFRRLATASINQPPAKLQEA